MRTDVRASGHIEPTARPRGSSTAILVRAYRQLAADPGTRQRVCRKRRSRADKFEVLCRNVATCWQFGQVEPWVKGRTGKFVVDYDGDLEAWSTDSSGSPHHADAVTFLGRSSAIEGEVRADGTLDVLASDPRAELDVIKARATQRAHALGMEPPSTWIRSELHDPPTHFG